MDSKPFSSFSPSSTSFLNAKVPARWHPPVMPRWLWKMTVAASWRWRTTSPRTIWMICACLSSLPWRAWAQVRSAASSSCIPEETFRNISLTFAWAMPPECSWIKPRASAKSVSTADSIIWATSTASSRRRRDARLVSSVRTITRRESSYKDGPFRCKLLCNVIV